LPADFEMIESLRAGETVNIGPGVSVVRDESGLIEVHKKVETFTNSEAENVDLSNDCGDALFHDLRVQWRHSAWNGKRLRSKPGSEVFDAQSIGPKVILRHWQAGDRFQPIGMKVEVKLQDLFTNLKVPRAKRHKLVLAATDAGEIFWVEGLRIGERFKVRKSSKSVLQWAWQRLT
jgi:tRNA(Ile)-lysidine synthase